MGFGLEVDMIRQAHNLDLLTCPYVFDPGQARLMTEAGADVVVAHLGATVGGSVGVETALTLDESVRLVQAMHDAAVAARRSVLVLCHGGPLADPQDAAYLLERASGIAGFFGASAMERLPTERAIVGTIEKFKAIAVSPPSGPGTGVTS